MENLRTTNNFDFVFTNDGTTGLYNYDVQDIYHSSYGAKSEAIEKFIMPLNFEHNFLEKKRLNVLDICYGIGYNSKALINKIINTNYQGSIHIDALEYDKQLVLLSPFIKDGFFACSPEISYLLLHNLINEIYAYKKELSSILVDRKNKKFFEPVYMRFIKKYKNFGYSYNPTRQNNSFLHNIYYHCISLRNKNHRKRLIFNNFTFKTYFDDARKTVKQLKEPYDIIFLDAFTPVKLPTLWTIDFFKELYRLSSSNSMLITYSNSAAVRHAMIKAGFIVGKIYDKQNRNSGTCASKNPEFIQNKLDDYDLGLMQTNAGVYFKDKDLNLLPEKILANWQHEKNSSGLESSSHYIKTHKKLKDS